MSHFAVLVIGPDPEVQLDPYWELDLPKDELAQDYRAEFVTEVAADTFEANAREIIAGFEANKSELAATYRKMLAAGRIEEILENWYGGQQNDAGDWGYYRNQQTKWDWFVLGGRWQGSLHLLPGRTGATGEQAYEEEPLLPGTVDQARCGDVDWAKTRPPAGKFTPFAVLKHGEWHEIGEMGWWGVVRNEKDDAAWEEEVSRLLADVPADELVSVFDCHI
jgi:hypothetical protein